MPAYTASASGGSGAVHVGRQAIYDRDGGVLGYELLFRADAGAVDADERGAYATSQVLITAFTEIGIDALAGDRRCFVNLTREFVVGDLPLPFDAEQVVLEILETVTVDDEVTAGVGRLVDLGYAIALDDFVPGRGHERLLGLATYVKIDLLAADPAELSRVVSICRRYPRIGLIAERLETDADLLLARDLGFDYFQGYVLSRPEVVSALALSPSGLRRAELLGLLVNPEARMDRAVSLVTGDPALSLRMLAVANADALRLPVKVSSIHEALLLLGVDRMRDWAALMLVSDLHHSEEPALVAAVNRARMCQNIAERLGIPAEAAFTVGLVSAAAEMLRQSPAELAPRLSLSHEVTEALVAGTGPLAELLSLVFAYESSDLPALITPPTSAP
jgi:EAL and modified HD-GYP domain-containing signal transduction protein